MHSCYLLLLCLLPFIQTYTGDNSSTGSPVVLPVPNQIARRGISYDCETLTEYEISEWYQYITISEEEFDFELNEFFANLSILLSEDTMNYEEFVLKYIPLHLNEVKSLIEELEVFEPCSSNSRTSRYINKFSKIFELRDLLDFDIIILNNLNNYIYYSRIYFVTLKERVNQFMEFYQNWSTIKTLVINRHRKILTLRDNLYDEKLRNEIQLKRNLIRIMSNLIHSINNLKDIEVRDREYKHNIRFFIRDHMEISKWESKLKEWQNELLLDEEFYGEVAIYVSYQFLIDKIQPSIFGTIFVIGILENGLLMLVFILNKNMRNKPNFSVINLTIADIISLVVHALLFIFQLKENLTSKDIICTFYLFGEQFMILLSIYSIVLVSLQRFFAVVNICKWDVFQSILMKKLAPYIPIAFVWIISVIFATLYLWFDQDLTGFGIFCTIYFPPNYVTIMAISELVIYCIVPLGIISVTSIITSYRIRTSIKNIPGEAEGFKSVIKARASSSKIVLALTVVFIVSYFPYYLLVLYERLCFTYKCQAGIHIDILDLRYAISVTRAMISLNSCWNPIVLYFMSRNYRVYMNKYLTCGLVSRISKPSRPRTRC